MAGATTYGIREGYRAESLLTFELRAIASVATVQNWDDIGIDLMAHILSVDTSRRLAQPTTFGIQCKAVSVKHFDFDAAASKWLSELRLPFFFARVDRHQGLIEIFAVHNALDLLCTRPGTPFRYSFPDMGAKTKPPPVSYELITSGDPIASWGRGHLEEKKNRQTTADLLTAWVNESWLELKKRPTGRSGEYAYQTNKPPRVGDSQMLGESHLIGAIEHNVHALEALVMTLLSTDLMPDGFLLMEVLDRIRERFDVPKLAAYLDREQFPLRGKARATVERKLRRINEAKRLAATIPSSEVRDIPPAKLFNFLYHAADLLPIMLLFGALRDFATASGQPR